MLPCRRPCPVKRHTFSYYLFQNNIVSLCPRLLFILANTVGISSFTCICFNVGFILTNDLAILLFNGLVELSNIDFSLAKSVDISSIHGFSIIVLILALS